MIMTSSDQMFFDPRKKGFHSADNSERRGKQLSTFHRDRFSSSSSPHRDAVYLRLQSQATGCKRVNKPCFGHALKRQTTTLVLRPPRRRNLLPFRFTMRFVTKSFSKLWEPWVSPPFRTSPIPFALWSSTTRLFTRRRLSR